MKRIHVNLYQRYLADLYSKESKSTVEASKIQRAFHPASQQFSFNYEPLNKYMQLAGGLGFSGFPVEFVWVDSKTYSEVLAAAPKL